MFDRCSGEERMEAVGPGTSQGAALAPLSPARYPRTPARSECPGDFQTETPPFISLQSTCGVDAPPRLQRHPDNSGLEAGSQPVQMGGDEILHGVRMKAGSWEGSEPAEFSSPLAPSFLLRGGWEPLARGKGTSWTLECLEEAGGSGVKAGLAAEGGAAVISRTVRQFPEW